MSSSIESAEGLCLHDSLYCTPLIISLHNKPRLVTDNFQRFYDDFASSEERDTAILELAEARLADIIAKDKVAQLIRLDGQIRDKQLPISEEKFNEQRLVVIQTEIQTQQMYQKAFHDYKFAVAIENFDISDEERNQILRNLYRLKYNHFISPKIQPRLNQRFPKQQVAQLRMLVSTKFDTTL